MRGVEKRVFYQAGNTYSTLNDLTEKTENIWILFHGMGFLSRYFLKPFQSLEPEKNYLIAPQAPSKYYQDKQFKYVGASWLTKENTLEELKNVLNYVDAVYEAEVVPASPKLILFGFSQGVSIGLRWLVSRKIKPDLLILYAGGIPKELTSEDGEILTDVPVKIVYGNQDPYLTEERLREERALAEKLFHKAKVETLIFEGKHEVKSEVIRRLI